MLVSFIKKLLIQNKILEKFAIDEIVNKLDAGLALKDLDMIKLLLNESPSQLFCLTYTNLNTTGQKYFSPASLAVEKNDYEFLKEILDFIFNSSNAHVKALFITTIYPNLRLAINKIEDPRERKEFIKCFPIESFQNIDNLPEDITNEDPRLTKCIRTANSFIRKGAGCLKKEFTINQSDTSNPIYYKTLNDHKKLFPESEARICPQLISRLKTYITNEEMRQCSKALLEEDHYNNIKDLLKTKPLLYFAYVNKSYNSHFSFAHLAVEKNDSEFLKEILNYIFITKKYIHSNRIGYFIANFYPMLRLLINNIKDLDKRNEFIKCFPFKSIQDLEELPKDIEDESFKEKLGTINYFLKRAPKSFIGKHEGNHSKHKKLTSTNSNSESSNNSNTLKSIDQDLDTDTEDEIDQDFDKGIEKTGLQNFHNFSSIAQTGIAQSNLSEHQKGLKDVTEAEKVRSNALKNNSNIIHNDSSINYNLTKVTSDSHANYNYANQAMLNQYASCNYLNQAAYNPYVNYSYASQANLNHYASYNYASQTGYNPHVNKNYINLAQKSMNNSQDNYRTVLTTPIPSTSNNKLADQFESQERLPIISASKNKIRQSILEKQKRDLKRKELNTLKDISNFSFNQPTQSSNTIITFIDENESLWRSRVYNSKENLDSSSNAKALGKRKLPTNWESVADPSKQNTKTSEKHIAR